MQRKSYTCSRYYHKDTTLLDIKSKIWFEIDGQAIMGSGRLKLLQAIETTGSISEAAKMLDMSYKKAWKLVKLMNEGFGKPLVQRTIGGKGGGGTILTDDGRLLIEQYTNIKTQIYAKIDELKADLDNL